jgi:hypothetical protein
VPLRVAESLTEPPARIFVKERVVVIVALAGITKRVTIAVWVRDPNVAVTFSLKVPASCPGVIVNVVEFPIEVNLTIVSENCAEGPAGDTETERVTVPVNPLELVSEMLSVPVTEFATSVRDDLLGMTAKSTM